jgi:type I restriction enzyme S subunit
MDELPNGWVKARLKELVNIKYGKNLPTKLLTSDGKYQVFGANGIIGFHNEYLYDEEQVLVSCRGANSGAINFSPSKCFITNNSLILELSDNFQDMKKFLYYALHAADKSMLVTGTAQPQVTIENAAILEIRIPPLNEQRRIVAKLEKLLAKCKACKQRLDKIPGILKRFRQSILAAACSGRLTADWREQNPDAISPIVTSLKDDIEGLDDLPKIWSVGLIESVIESLKYGTSKKSDYEVEGIPILRIPNIGDRFIEPSDLKYAKLSEKELKELKLLPGDILIIRSNGSVSLVGKSAIIRESEKGFAYAGYLIRLRPNQSLINPDYLNLCISSYPVRFQIEIPARSTSGVNNINSSEVKNLRIAIPPIEEQKEIVQRVDNLFKLADQIEQRYEKARAYVDKLPQSILAKAFRGELVPQDPNDEPASVLLERIQAEREQQPPSNRRKRGLAK